MNYYSTDGTHDASKSVRRGDIYWIGANPYREAIGHVQRPGRPGIIVSSDTINDKLQTYEIVYLTTTPKRDELTHCTVRSSRKVSTALCEQIHTISDEQIGDYIGSCTPSEMESIERCMAISLDMNSSYTEREITSATTSGDSDEIQMLEKELEKAKHTATILRQLYNELLEKTLGIDSPEKVL